jgi:F-type H+-transporting ATPase subunit alpha
MKSVAGTLRIDLSQYRELEAFSKFGSDLDPATQRQLRRGERLVEILKQDQYDPMPVEEQVVIIYVAVEGMLDSIALDDISAFEEELLERMKVQHEGVLDEIRETQKLSDDAKAVIEKAAEELAGIYSETEEDEEAEVAV